MPFSKEDKALTNELTPVQKIGSTEDIDDIFEDKLQKRRTGHFSKKIWDTLDRPQARERLTKARAYWRERDNCGWTGKPHRPGSLETNTSFNTPDIQSDGPKTLYHRIGHSPSSWSEVSFVYQHACWLLLLVFLICIFRKVVYWRP